MPGGVTTIQIKDDTADYIYGQMERGETYDDVLRRLLKLKKASQ